MRISTWLSSLALTGLFAAGLQAQPATQEQIQKALELLRQTSSTPVPATNQPPPRPVPSTPATNNPSPPVNQTTPAQPAFPPASPVGTLPKESSTPAPQPANVPKTPAPLPVQPVPPPTPSGLTPDTEQKARDLLRSTEVAPQPSADQRSDQARDQAIRSALEEAQRLEADRKLTRKQNPQAANEAAMQEEIIRIEAELLKAKQDHPPSLDLARPSASQTVTPLPPASPSLPPPASPPLPSPSAIPTAKPSTTLPPMKVEEEQRARQLLEQQLQTIAPGNTAGVPQPESKPPADASKPIPVQPTAGNVSAPKAAPSPAPAPTPGGIPSAKAKRLADLLEAYRKDQISAAEYHKQRSQILAEP